MFRQIKYLILLKKKKKNPPKYIYIFFYLLGPFWGKKNSPLNMALSLHGVLKFMGGPSFGQAINCLPFNFYCSNNKFIAFQRSGLKFCWETVCPVSYLLPSKFKAVSLMAHHPPSILLHNLTCASSVCTIIFQALNFKICTKYLTNLHNIGYTVSEFH